MQTIINLFKMLRVLGQFQPEPLSDGLRIVHKTSGCSVTFRDDGSLITWAPKNNLPQAGEVLMLNCRDEYVNRLNREQLEARERQLLKQIEAECRGCVEQTDCIHA